MAAPSKPGPDSFLSIKPAALDLIGDLGLRDDVIGSNDHLRVTFVRKGGKLVPLPDGLMMMVPTKILPLVTTPLLSIGTKIRMGLELLRAPKMKPGDESRWPISCASTTGRRRWIISPNRCSAGSMAATRANSA